MVNTNIIIVVLASVQVALGELWCPLNCTCSMVSGRKRPIQYPSIASADGKIVWPDASVTQTPSSQLIQVFQIDCSGKNIHHLWEDFWNKTNSPWHHSRHHPSVNQSSFPSVSILILSDNEISELRPHDMTGNNVVQSLRKLYLNSNHLTRLSNHTFEQLASLEYLNLASNQITTLEVLCFKGLNRLKTLDLSYNRIQVFPATQISPLILISLVEINLRQNQIKWIPERAFNWHTNETNSSLIIFDVAANPIAKVHVNAFVNLSRLRKVYLSEIQNQQVFPSLANSNSIEHIKLDRCRLRAIDQSLCRHVGDTLKSLILKSNQIQKLPPMELCTEIRVLDLSYNELKVITENTFESQQKLIDLALGHNFIEHIDADTFSGLRRLKVLNLESNLIKHIDPNAFEQLNALRDLNLGHNQFSELPIRGITNVVEIKVHGNRNLREFPPVEAFPFVHRLAMSYAYHCCPYLNRMQVHRVSSLESQEDQWTHDSILWLENTDSSNLNLTISELAQQFWKQYHQPTDYEEYEVEQANLQYFANDLLSAVESPTYPWDNIADDPPREEGGEVFLQPGQTASEMKLIKCSPIPDPFMPCNDLFDWWTLRLGVWIVFPLALIGNGIVLVVLVFGRRRRRRRKLDVPRFLICNLAAADFFMGIYLGMLAIVDAFTLGHFRSYAIRWQNSWACQITGFSGVFSAELSVYTLAVITLERNYAITHAMHLNKRLSLRAATIVMSIGWCFSLLMAILPLCGISDYRKFAVCLPFETDNSIWSLLYVISLIIFNGFAFLLLMACYLRMYCAIRGSQAWNSNDIRIAMRMGLLVFTDFLCWAPIAFFTITAIFGWNLISLDEAKIFTVFVLPLNACANPFLYAFFTKQFKKECATLYKRIDAVTGIGNSCLGRNETGSDLEVAIVIDCKICNHQDRSLKLIEPNRAVPSGSNYQFKNKINQSFDSERQHIDEQGGGADLAERDPGHSDGLADLEEAVKNTEKIVPTHVHDDCLCHCHKERPKTSKTPRLRKSNSATIDTGKSWNTNQIMKQLFFLSDKHSKTRESKQYKNNSIIYQSNYRKNHIHMTLGDEMKSPVIHHKLTRFSSDNSSAKKANKKYIYNKVNLNISHSSANESRHVNEQEKSNSFLAEAGNRSSSSSKGKISKLSDYDDKLDKENQLRCSGADNGDRSPHSEIKDDRVIYVKNNTPSTVTSSIMMLKNKLIRKTYVRKLSSDSQYEFSNFSNRKDSTSTGRLSFSSENATKSTSSSFVSSGIWNSGGRSTSKSTNRRRLVLNKCQYEELLQLSKDFPPNYRKPWRKEETTELDSRISERYILLTLSKKELYSVLSEKHSGYKNHPTYHNCLNVIVDEKEQSSESDGKVSPQNRDNLFVAYILSNTSLNSEFAMPYYITVNDENQLQHLQAYLAVNRAGKCSEANQTEDGLIEIDITLCPDCIQHYLINKLMELLDTGNMQLFDIQELDLCLRTLLLKCSIQLADAERNECEEISEEATSSSKSEGDLGKRFPISKTSVNGKKLNTNHDKILNFLQLLLPKSRGSVRGKSKHNLEVRPQQRRSSSAFVLGEEIDHDMYANRELCVKSCSQLQVLSGESSASQSKSSSVHDARCRSVISDVVITVNHANSPEPIRHNISENTIYNSLPNKGLKACSHLDDKYHSCEYIG